jgi:hypothetical protein
VRAPVQIRPKAGILDPPGQAVDPALPALRHDAPVVCAEFPSTQRMPSGAYRLQCDEAKRECLVAPAHELAASSDDSSTAARRNVFEGLKTLREEWTG